MGELKSNLGVAARAGAVAASVIPGGLVGAAAAGAALFNLPKTAPARPSWTPSASLDNIQDSQTLDEHWSRALAADFETVGIMTGPERKLHHPKHGSHNMDYIPAPGSLVGHAMDNTFFKELVRRQWKTAAVTRGAFQDDRMGSHRPIKAGAPEYSALKFSRVKSWDGITDLERINAYTFRGDTRDPIEVKKAEGFRPPSSRTDDTYVNLIASAFVSFMHDTHGKQVNRQDVIKHIKGERQRGEDFVRLQMWRHMMDNEQFHIGEMVKHEFLKGFISTSRDPYVSWKFADRWNPSTTSWLYAVHVKGGFLLPSSAVSTNIHAGKDEEAEVAFPGNLSFGKVVGVARLSFSRNMSPVVPPFVMYYRHGFRQSQPKAFQMLHASFSTVCRPYQENV